MKKFLCAMLCMFMLATPFALTGCDKDGGGKDAAIVWSALATEKFMRDQKPEEYTEAKLDFAGMKGETQSAQLMVTAKEDIKGFNLTAAKLSGENGAEISADNIKIYAERYVEIYNPYVNWHHGGEYYADAGVYPDALVPIDKFRKTREDRIAKDNNQGIWVDIDIPADAASGTYSGEFTLTLNESETKSIPVTLKVYNAVMPEEVHAESYFCIWYDQLGFGEGDNFDSNTNKIYYDYLLSKRLCSGEVNPDYTKSMDSFISHITELAQNPRVTSYRIPDSLIGFNREVIVPQDETQYTPEQVEQAREQLQSGLKNQMKQILEANFALREEHATKDVNLLEKAIYYFEDEPTVGYRTNRVRVFCERLNAAKKELLSEYAARFAEHPDLKKSFESLHNVTPSNYVDSSLTVSSKNPAGETYEPDYEKADGLQHWCPEMYKWSETAFRATVRERQSYGEEFWWYTCVVNSPAPSYYVESMPINIRLASWMQYQYGVTGTLYWDVVHWKEIAGGDPYEDVQYNVYGGGEGLLLYPGAKYGQKTPISSIRLEQVRLGQQDYEYFYMLDVYLREANSDYKAATIIAEMGKTLYNGATTSETASYAEFENNRLWMLDVLQDFANNDASAALTKIAALLD